MLFFGRNKSRYVALGDEDLPEFETELKMNSPRCALAPRTVSYWPGFLLLFVCIPLTSLVTVLVTRVIVPSKIQPESTNVVCTCPSIRREWRTIDKSDRLAYLDAVKCLASVPSTLMDNGTMYDDFPWVHQHIAPTAHQSAPFLPWHRYYIHSYETALKEHCGFEGALPYWDWSLDTIDFTSSPVWSHDYGFGGDGAADSTTTVGDGRCVETGPFAGLTARYFADSLQPHCLSRGFAQGDELRDLAALVAPEAIEELMEESDYTKFAPELERRAHKFVSHSIRGDFSRYTGPYDPIFFLHHANLDRLWTKWQAKHDPMAYGGKAGMYSPELAAFGDKLNVGDLLSDVAVVDVMSTESGLLCYQY